MELERVHRQEETQLDGAWRKEERAGNPGDKGTQERIKRKEPYKKPTQVCRCGRH